MSADRKPILVMFDIDGTLTQTVDIDTACFSVAVSELIGGHVQPNDWIEAPHMTDWGIVGYLHRVHHQREMTAGELRVFRDRFTELLRQTLAQHDEKQSIATPGAHALLDALRESSEFEVSIATGACRSAAELKLKHSELFDEDVPLASSDDAIARADIMRHSRSLAAAHQRVIYVGDGAWDAKASNELGWPLIGVQAHERRAQALKDAGAATVVPDFRNTGVVLDAIREFAK
jgi:phosphoglycolate phosphatase-like HAD superfamily hydrolase